MKPALALAAAIAWAATAPNARAGEAPCWVDEGVLVVGASVMGIAGDYILDTGSPHTELHETRAQGAGFTATALAGPARLAGVVEPGRPIAVVDLDPRTVRMPTPIAGVIGADLLRGYVLDLSFSPCRIGLYAPGRAPRFGRGAVLPLTWLDGRPAVSAAVADGPRATQGVFVPATGSDTAVRLDERAARVPGAARPEALYPYGRARAELRALSLGGDLYERLPAGLLATQGETPAALGTIGLPVLMRHRLRFDFPRGRLLIGPQQ